MTGQSQGAISRLAINGQEMEFLSIEGGMRTMLTDNTERAIRGTLSRSKERVKEGLQVVDIAIRMNPSPAELDVILPLIGMVESPTDTFTVIDGSANTLGDFTVIIDRVAKVHTYANCKIDKAVFRGQKGADPIELELRIMGTTESEGAAGSFSASAIDTGIAYSFCEGVMTLDSTQRGYDRFALSIDNMIQRQFNNSCTATSLVPTDRAVTLATSVSYVAANTGLYTTPATPDATGIVGSLAFTDGGQSTTFTMINLKSIAQSPSIPGKTEIRLPLFYKAYKSGSTAELIVTHDATA